jgi:hypothetical protein
MKIVKITPKFKAYRHGFKYGLRFDQYGADVARHKLYEMYGSDSWWGQWHYKIPGRRDAKTRCFLSWIYLRNEADITLLQLAGAFDES